MCFFPLPNNNYNSIAYKKGLYEFDCGKCPECLGKRSSAWALRAVMQARESKDCCMVTLTYDTFKRDENGKIMTDKDGIPLENRADINVDKRDCQLFIKRLREYFERVKGVTGIKYIISAEYGKRILPGHKRGRPHYHALLFGVKFDDLIFHKKSKRGNKIYISKTLDKLWKNGICTVDASRVSASIAKYCTKYCMKDFGADDTFMLASHSLGLNELMKAFNGRSYWLDGQEYPIPRVVWQQYITNKYNLSRKKFRFIDKETGEILISSPTYKYINKEKNSYKGIEYRFCKRLAIKGSIKHFKSKDLNFLEKYVMELSCFGYKYKYVYCSSKLGNPFKLLKSDRIKSSNDIEHKANEKARELYRAYRDRDSTYQGYLSYWESKSNQKIEKDIHTKIALLRDIKYHNYKSLAWKYLAYRVKLPASVDRDIIKYSLPRFERIVKRKNKDLISLYKSRYGFQEFEYDEHLPVNSCHIRANDRKEEDVPRWVIFDRENVFENSVKNTSILKKMVTQLKIL